MTKNKFPRSVSFNLKNQEDVAILEYVKKRNFSGYVKDLILADMKNNNVRQNKFGSQPQKTLSKLEQLRQNIDNHTSNNSDTKSDK